ncbi:hypothetical protein EYS14_22955 [Alteromonadaceae bacterium M269]|nr:hypothetical protein EYS14_22955 [Alteromonadaceae bacterium M269]
MKKVFFAALLLASGYSQAACVKTNTVDTPSVHINNINNRFGIVWLTNTSNHSVDVSITSYDQTGADVSSAVVSGGTSQTIPAKGSTGFVLRGNGATRTVYSELTWTSNACLKKPMNGSLETQWINSISIQNINAGKPF